jgi:hypothetical protein
LQLKKTYPVFKEKIDVAVKSEQKYLKEATVQFDDAISNFAIAVLEALKSSLIANESKEIERIKAATEQAIGDLRASGEPGVVAFLDQQLKRLGSIDRIKSAIEGVVFRYDGKTYKFTGAFAAANQIIGFIKYRRPELRRDKISENYLRRVIRELI